MHQSTFKSVAHYSAEASVLLYIKLDSQYDAGAASVTSVVSVTENSIKIFTNQIIILMLNF